MKTVTLLILGSHASVRHQVNSRIIGEFDDGALMNAFRREGRGVFLAPTVLKVATMAHFGVEL